MADDAPIRAEDILNSNTLEKWLERRPRADAVAIAHRAALRVFPLWGEKMGHDWARDANLTALPVLCCYLISAVAAQMPTADISAVGNAVSATAAASTAVPSPGFADVAAILAADAATAEFANVAYSSACGAAVAAASVAQIAAVTARTAVWTAIRRDAVWLENDQSPLSVQLWLDAVPDVIARAETATRDLWKNDPPDRWDFWVRWWDAALQGKYLDPQLQLAIVKGVDNNTWAAGPDAVAARIREIEGEFKSLPQVSLTLENLTMVAQQLDAAVEQNPHAWRVDIDPKTGLFAARAVEPRDLGEIVKSARSAISDFNRRCKAVKVGNFGQAVQLAFEPVIATLRRDLSRHKSEPFSLYKSIEYARSEMEDISTAEGFLGESFITRFFKTLDDLGEDICLSAPEVVEQLKAKSALRYELWDLEKRSRVMRQTFGLHLDAEGILKRTSLEALRVLTDEAATDAQKKDAYYFCTAVLPRATRAYVAQIAETGETPKQSDKTLAKRTLEAADALSKLDKGVDALQENIPEAYGFASEIVQSILTSGAL